MKDGWKEIELKEIAPYWTKKIDASELNENNYISADNMITDRGGISNSVYVPTSGKSSSYSQNDILVSNIRPYFKKIWFAKFKGGCSNDVIVFRVNQTIADSKFVYYYLSKDDFFDYMMAGSNGTKMPRGNKKSIPEYKIQLPPLPTQRKIASILSAYDDLVENNLKRIKLLEEKAQRTYEEWFVKMRFPGYETAQFDKESGLPEGWEKKTCSDLFDIQGGTQPPKKEWSEFPKQGYIRMVQIRDYYTDSHIAYVKNKNTLKKCNENDIMIARYGASVGRICWGIEGAYNVALVKVLPYKSEYVEFLRLYLKSSYFQDSLLSRTQRTAQDGFNKNTFNSIDVLLAPIQILKEFDNYSSLVNNEINLFKKQNRLLKEARDLLLPRLMSGMIDVDKVEVANLAEI